MGDYDDIFSGAMVAMFVIGVIVAGAMWLLWHFVLSHITIGWTP